MPVVELVAASLLKTDILQNELEVALEAAFLAGQEVLEIYKSKEFTAEEKSQINPVTEADLRANKIILQNISSRFPGDFILSEETAPSSQVEFGQRMWIVDPMDGTREFISKNGDFCVMIGLVESGIPVLGVIYHPTEKTMYAGVMDSGAWKIKGYQSRHETVEPLHAKPYEEGQLRLVHSRNHKSKKIDALIEYWPTMHHFAMGSAGLKCMAVLEGKAHLYFHPTSHIKEWDTCAPEAILRAAGAVVTDCRHKPLTYGKSDPRQTGGILASVGNMPAMLADFLKTLAPSS